MGKDCTGRLKLCCSWNSWSCSSCSSGLSCLRCVCVCVYACVCMHVCVLSVYVCVIVRADGGGVIWHCMLSRVASRACRCTHILLGHHAERPTVAADSKPVIYTIVHARQLAELETPELWRLCACMHAWSTLGIARLSACGPARVGRVLLQEPHVWKEGGGLGAFNQAIRGKRGPTAARGFSSG